MEANNMNFLMMCGVTNDVIKKIIENNNDSIILNAEWNIENVVSSIEYFKSIGIENIDDILINRFDIFLRGREKLKKKIDSLKEIDFINSINLDIKNINLLD